MDYNKAALTAISSQFIAYTSWKQIYSDTSSSILTGDQLGGAPGTFTPLFYLDVISLTALGLIAGVRNYVADLIMDVSVPVGPETAGLHGDTLLDEDKNLIDAIIQPLYISKIIMQFFDNPVFAPPAIVIGDVYNQVLLSFKWQEQPRLLRGSNRILVRHHIAWQFLAL